MTEREALKLALEALEVVEPHTFPDSDAELFSRSAITAIREVLEQPEQEPVAYGMWDTMLGKENRMMMVRLDKGQDGCTVPLYTSLLQRKPLEGVIDVQPIGYHSLQLIFRSQTDIAKFKAAHGIKEAV